MSSKAKHALRSQRSYRTSRNIPQFQVFYSRKQIRDMRSFSKGKISFAEHMANFFALFSLMRRKRG